MPEDEHMSTSTTKLETILDITSLTSFSIKKSKLLEKMLLQFFKGKNDQILEVLFDNALASDNFGYAHKYSVKLNDKDRAIKLFNKWAGSADPCEKDLFIARYILLYFFLLIS